MNLSQRTKNFVTSKEAMAYICSFAFYFLSAFGISLTVKASIGVSCFNSMLLSITCISGIKLGTIVIIFNGLFLMAYMQLTNYEYKRKYIFQTMFVLIFGSFVNLFTYTVLGGFIASQYPMRVFLMILGTVISSTSVGVIVYCNVITFPVESVCVAVSEKTKYSFTQCRYAVDFVSITASILLAVIFSIHLNVREGTLISMIIFPYVTGRVNKACQSATSRTKGIQNNPWFHWQFPKE